METIYLKVTLTPINCSEEIGNILFSAVLLSGVWFHQTHCSPALTCLGSGELSFQQSHGVRAVSHWVVCMCEIVCERPLAERVWMLMKEGMGRQSWWVLTVRKQRAHSQTGLWYWEAKVLLILLRGGYLVLLWDFCQGPSERQTDLFLLSRIYNVSFSDWLFVWGTLIIKVCETPGI